MLLQDTDNIPLIYLTAENSESGCSLPAHLHPYPQLEKGDDVIYDMKYRAKIWTVNILLIQ